MGRYNMFNEFVYVSIAHLPIQLHSIVPKSCTCIMALYKWKVW